MRYLLLWAVLFAVYASALGIDAVGDSDYSGGEARLLMTAASLAADGDADISDEHAELSQSAHMPTDVPLHGRLTDGRVHDPQGVGLPALVAPAYLIGGPRGVEVLLAAVMALAFTVAGALARIVVPDPWATRGVAVVGLSPPVVAHATAITPDAAAALCLAVAVLFAARTREDLRVPPAAASALALAGLPWLGPEYVIAGVPVAAMLIHWTLRQHRRLPALVAVEVLSTSLIAYTALNGFLYGGFTPLAADVEHLLHPDLTAFSGYVERAPRFAGLWLDRDVGIVRWAPIAVLSLFGVWLLWRSHRDSLSRALPTRREAEAVAALAVAACAGQLVVATLMSVDLYETFPGRHLAAVAPLAAVLVAWASRHLPRVAAVLGALTLLATAWLLVQLRTGTIGAWSPPLSSVPWGPLKGLLPSYASGSVWADALSVILAGVVLIVVATQWRAAHLWRHSADAPRQV
jgi:hypothetical protein